MKTPTFWYRKKESPAPLIEHLLAPFSALYGLGIELKKTIQPKQPQSIGIPVICVGNLNAGGTGKTPTAIALLKLIKEQNLAQNPFFLTRGYGGTIKKPTQVTPSVHTYQDTGDEPLLLAQHAPTIISPNRFHGGKLAQQKGADLIIMDDGLQNNDLKQDIKIILIDSQMAFGNEKILPAGPLREPLASGLKKANIFIQIGEETPAFKLPKPLFKAQLQTDTKLCDKRPWIAFSGLGYPQKFFNFLDKELGLNIVDTISFPDHHAYAAQDIVKLRQKAQEKNAKLITTEKDKIRLPKDMDVQTVPVSLAWDNEKKLINFLKSKLT